VQVLPDVLGRVEFGCGGRQADQGEVCRKLELSRAMLAGAVEDDHGVSALGHGFADFGEVQFEGMGVGARQHQGGAGPGPFFAQARVSVPCGPTRASSRNQISSGLPSALTGRLSPTVRAKVF
jgi:hypothetical protein